MILFPGVLSLRSTQRSRSSHSERRGSLETSRDNNIQATNEILSKEQNDQVNRAAVLPRTSKNVLLIFEAYCSITNIFLDFLISWILSFIVSLCIMQIRDHPGLHMLYSRGQDTFRNTDSIG